MSETAEGKTGAGKAREERRRGSTPSRLIRGRVSGEGVAAGIEKCGKREKRKRETHIGDIGDEVGGDRSVARRRRRKPTNASQSCVS